MKDPSKLLGVALPIATIVVLVVLLTGSGVPQIGAMPDMIVTVLELSVRTLYAIAIGGSTALAMQMTGMNLSNDYRCELTKLAASGQFGAIIVLMGETFAWLAWAIFWAFVYLP